MRLKDMLLGSGIKQEERQKDHENNSVRKLRLNKDTVKQLTEVELKRVVGGDTSSELHCTTTTIG